MASKVDICNFALGHIGAFSIQSLDEATNQARKCNLFYDSTRDTVLRDHAWGFARKSLVLALSTETVSGWDYAYAYPQDCIRAVQIHSDVESATELVYDWDIGVYLPVGRIEFEIAVSTDLTGTLVLTNEQSAELIYTARVDSPNLYDAMFVDALALALAIKLIVPLKGDEAKKRELKDEYLRLITRAKVRSADEGYKKPDNTNSFVNAR